MVWRDFISSPRRRWALTLWVILAMAVVIKIICVPGKGSVYPVFADSAHHWWAQTLLYAPYGTREGPNGFRYSPTFAVAMTPLAYLPYKLGAILWSLGSIAVLVWALLVAMRDVLPPPLASEGWSPRWQQMFLILVLAGSAVGIWSAQSNALVTALILLGLAAVTRQRWSRAALWLALAVFIKIWPLAIVLLLIACWPRALAARFLIACLLLAAIPFLTHQPDVVLRYYHDWYLCLIGPLQARNCGYRDAWTFWEVFGPWFGGQPDWSSHVQRHVFAIIQLVTGLGVFGWCYAEYRRTRQPCSTLAPSRQLLTSIFAVWAAWQLLFGPGTEQLTYGLIAPAAAWAVLVSFAERRARGLALTAWTLLTFMSAGDIEWAVRHVLLASYLSPVARALLPFGVVLFLVWLLRREQVDRARRAA